MQNILEMGIVVIVFIAVIVIGLYIASAIFLNKFNKLVNGKGTPIAWLPIANCYLLGKLAVNKVVGWILVTCTLLTGSFTVEVNGEMVANGTILPEGFSNIISVVLSLAIIGLFIYAIVKYRKLKKTSFGATTITRPTTPPIAPAGFPSTTTFQSLPGANIQTQFPYSDQGQSIPDSSENQKLPHNS